jgi:endonuclease IV
MYACTHGKLLYNIAGSADPQDLEKMWWKTKLGLTSELDITAGFGDGVVVHMGSCKDKKAGLSNITKTLEYVLTHETDQTKELIKELQDPDLVKKRMVILENSAGEGTKFGSTLEEIGQIISSVKPELQDQIRVCIDTAHIYGAGQYDFGVVREVDRFVQDFDKIIGLEKLKMFHLNDSRATYNSKKDKHDNLALGYIFNPDKRDSDGLHGLFGLNRLLEFCSEREIPLVGEPPYKGADGKVGPHGWWDIGIVKALCDPETINVCI